MITFNTIVYAADGTAWKTSSMRGYICKVGDRGADTFQLQFFKADPTVSTPAMRFTFVRTSEAGAEVPTYAPAAFQSGSSSQITPADVTDDLDVQLLMLLLSGDWYSGRATEFETARTADSTGW